MHVGQIARAIALAGVACLGASPPVPAQERIAQIRPVTGLTLVSTLQSPQGDREDLIELKRVDSAGIHYVWRLVEFWHDGDTVGDVRERRVRANDLAGAPRWDPIFAPGDALERPGFTAFSISSAVYVTIRHRGSARFTATMADTTAGALASLGMRGTRRRVQYKGTLTRVSPDPDPFPLLVDGRRVTVPALHLRGDFADGARSAAMELWVVADSAHPMLLKAVKGSNVFQMVRVNFPLPASGAAATGGAGTLRMGAFLERELDTACRVELPGVYFAFNSARIAPASDRALAQVAAVLTRHPDWSLAVEGHTDSIGTVAANQTLSLHRAEAVRTRLAERHGLNSASWKATGYGASRPRESNATIEGRARNRRVELVRACSERS
jgi:outer membrane protein OmpA-like peptidoglycan-associated protein